MESIEFNTNIDLPYKFIFQLKDYFNQKSDISTDLLIKSCHKFINDTFNLPLCLFFSPNTIAISCVKLMIENYKLIDINLNDIIRKSEYKIKSEDVDFCFNLMQKFYKNSIFVINKFDEVKLNLDKEEDVEKTKTFQIYDYIFRNFHTNLNKNKIITLDSRNLKYEKNRF